jgi:hypothetical protein
MSDESLFQTDSGIFLPRPEGYRATAVSFNFARQDQAIDGDPVDIFRQVQTAIANGESLECRDPLYGEPYLFTKAGLHSIMAVCTVFIPHSQIKAQMAAQQQAQQAAQAGIVAPPNGFNMRNQNHGKRRS